MQITKTHKIIAGIVGVLLVLAIAYMVYNKKSNKLDTTNNQNATSSAIGISSNDDKKVIQKDGYTIEQIPIEGGSSVPKPIPDLNRAIIVWSGAVVAPEAKAMAVEKIKPLQTKLKANPADFNAWIDLGIYQKMGGDYQGAVLSWQYASKLAPSDYIAFGNLGNIYGYFIKDNVKAESNYKLAISKGPMQAYLYIQLGEFYRDVLKDISKAKSIVEQGLQKVPNDPTLLTLKADLN